MNYTIVVLGGVLLLSVIWYYFPVYGGVHWFTGPVPNVENVVSRDSFLEDKKAGTVGTVMEMNGVEA